MTAHPHRPTGRQVGLLGAVVGLAAAGTAVGVAVARSATRSATSRTRAEQAGKPDVDTAPAGQLRTEDPLGDARRDPDRSALVRADDGVLLHVEEIGPAEAPLTVVFVHGYALSMASWAFQRRDLAARLATADGARPPARLVFYDQRGHGSSGRGEAAHSTIEQLAADLEQVLTARVPAGPVVLVGHSMGGMTVLALARRRPDLFGPRVRGVALVSTSAGNLADLDFGLPHLLTRVRAAVLPAAAWTMRHQPGFAEQTRRVARDLVSAATRTLSFAGRDVDPALVHYVDAMIAGTPVDVIAEFYPALVGLDESGAVEPLTRVPVLVLTGDSDRMIPMAHSELVVERLREEHADVEYVVVPDAGHLVLLERPDQVTRALGELVDRVAAAQEARP